MEEFFLFFAPRAGKRGDVDTNSGNSCFSFAVGNAVAVHCRQEQPSSGKQKRRADQPDKRIQLKTCKGQVSVELLIVFAALLSIYAVVFPSIAASYGKAVASVEEKVQLAAENRVENLVQQCNLLSEGSAFEQKIQLAHNETIFGVKLKRGVNLVKFNRTVENCQLTVVNADS